MKYIAIFFVFCTSSIGFARDCDGTTDMKQPVYKILRGPEWSEFKKHRKFGGSERDLRDGFIHLSPADQVERIIQKYFSAERSVYIVKFSHIPFLKRLVWEPASDGTLYPHLYNGPLNFDEIESVEMRE